MIALLIVALCIIGTSLSWIILGRLVNHVSIYSVVWTVMLVLRELGLIYYNELTTNTWLLILAAYITFVLGSLTPPFMSAITTSSNVVRQETLSATLPAVSSISRSNVIRNFILILSLLGSCSLFSLLGALMKSHGVSILANQSQLYRIRLLEGGSQGIPYLGSLIYVAAAFSGVYLRKFGFHPVTLVPVSLIGFHGLFTASRAGIVIGGAIFVSSFYLTAVSLGEPALKGKKTWGMLLLLLVTAIFLFFISSTRGLVVHFDPYESPTMDVLRRIHTTLPSIYVYLSGPPGVLNEFLKSGGEHAMPGSATLAPAFRLLAKLGVKELYVGYYEKAYFTPIQMNVGTYIRDVYNDAGVFGVVLWPYVLGFTCSTLWLRITNRKRHQSVGALIVLAFFYSIIWMSYDVWIPKLGYWLVGFIAALTTAIFFAGRWHCS